MDEGEFERGWRLKIGKLDYASFVIYLLLSGKNFFEQREINDGERWRWWKKNSTGNIYANVKEKSNPLRHFFLDLLYKICDIV